MVSCIPISSIAIYFANSSVSLALTATLHNVVLLSRILVSRATISNITIIEMLCAGGLRGSGGQGVKGS